MANPHFLIILCGGSGPRLWPLSRADNPKQFLKLLSQKSLLQETYSRALKIVPRSHIFFVSPQKYAPKIRAQIKTPNVILEPKKKNTALAILYSTAVIKKINPNAVITFLPADHSISPLKNFTADLKKAAAAALKSIVIFGVKPTSPDLSYGYILPHRFIEKPNLETAQKLISQGALWNSGIYTFSIPTLESEIAKIDPQLYSLYRQLSDPKKLHSVYQSTDSLPFDTVISEKSHKLTMIPANFNWNDIGEWKSLYQQLPKTDNNFATLNQTQFLQIGSRRCLLSSSKNKLIGLVGVNDLAVIDTPDALLICNIAHDDSFHVRDLVAKIIASAKTKKYFLKS